jgi:Ankyrin repeats (3 copies)
MSDTTADVCQRCRLGCHSVQTCIQDSMPLYKSGKPVKVDPNDVFMHSRVDSRIHRLLPTEIWQLLLSYLPVRDVLPAVPLTNKFLFHKVVWGKWSGPLLWGEMTRGPTGIDAEVFKGMRWEHVRRNVLCWAAFRRAPVTHVSTLLAGNVDKNAVDRWGRTAVYTASSRGHEDIVRVLLVSNADPNIANADGSTPLIAASCYGYSGVVLVLIEGGADINHADVRGDTALMRACKYSMTFRILMNARADINIMNSVGDTVLDYARLDNNGEVVRMLENAEKNEQNK